MGEFVCEYLSILAKMSILLWIARNGIKCLNFVCCLTKVIKNLTLKGLKANCDQGEIQYIFFSVFRQN